MYTTCMFCQKELGRNQVVEHFAVGRRLAFDARRGRLWVVCRKCERWNLTPLEERWEAVEELERLYRETRVRSQTRNVGLARHREGLEMVRIGEPLREEFAAWRYGDQFGRRRRRKILVTAGVTVGVGVVLTGAVAAGAISASILGQSGNWVNLVVNGRSRVKLRATDGTVLKLKRPDLLKTRLLETEDDQGWGIQVKRGRREEIFTGEDARRVAGKILPTVNAFGGSRQVVADAVARIEEVGDPERFIRETSSWRSGSARKPKVGMLAKLPPPSKLALEMALHEEEERRALNGELWVLERRWREAEEIAAIADGLLLPDGAGAFVEEHRPDAPGPDRTTAAGGVPPA